MRARERRNGAPVDPIAVRVNFLETLSPSKRKAFLGRALEASRRALARLEEAEGDPRSKDRWATAAALRGSLMQVRAKITWLEELRDGEV